MKTRKPKLIPPDLKQCQRMILKGAWPCAQHFMEIGPRETIRCTNKPVAIVYETKPGSDGRKGSMSLCGPCLAECMEAFPAGHLRVKKL